MERQNITIEFSKEDITERLRDLLPKDKSILAELISPLICENDLASSMFFKVLADINLPDKIPNGSLVEVDCDNILSYHSGASDVTVDNLTGEGKRVGQVRSHGGYHKYLPYTIDFPQDDSDGTFVCHLNHKMVSLVKNTKCKTRSKK